jgi:hypothetical protein
VVEVPAGQLRRGPARDQRDDEGRSRRRRHIPGAAPPDPIAVRLAGARSAGRCLRRRVRRGRLGSHRTPSPSPTPAR